MRKFIKKLILLLVPILLLTSCLAGNTDYNLKQTIDLESAVSTANSVASTTLPSEKSCSGATTGSVQEQAEPIAWHDKALEKIVRAKLKKPVGDIFTNELDNITELYIWGVTDKKIVSYALNQLGNEYIDEEGQKYTELGGIESIEDLRLFKELKSLTLCHQKVVDYSPMQTLTQLECLVLTGNGIKDLSFIKPLNSLKALTVDYNSIGSFACIDAFDTLEYLNVSYNDISTLTGIQNYNSLKTFIIDQKSRRPAHLARIKDISPLGGLKSLEILSMENQDVKDLTPLSGLSNLRSLNIKDSEVLDFEPLRNFKKLQILKLKNYDIFNNLAFLRTLPDLKETDIEEDDWKKINYPFKLAAADAVEGIHPGNIVNGGAVGFDGRFVYYEDIGYGDLGHPELLRFDNEIYLNESISGQITGQMSKIIGQKPGGVINESISFLNIYKGKLYFMGFGTNNDTAAPLDDGTYYPGDEVTGLARMNLDGSDRVILTKNYCSYINVINDKIYCLDKDGYPVSMGLEGEQVQILLKKTCNMMYIDGNSIYYQVKDSDKYLYRMNMDGSQPAALLETYCNRPIVLGNEIYYLNEYGNICMYFLEKHQQSILLKCKAVTFNLNGQYIYYSDENGIYRIDKEGQNAEQIYTGNAGTINVIGDYIFFNTIDGYCKIKNDGSEYTEYFSYF